nr:dnaJ homolog subfamily C member 1-like isoform X1 [Lytechinus pictus]XP_054767885.1 dnaJ homolog subfamily C member 1-like isoform X2 [Lytechinus pictus]
MARSRRCICNFNSFISSTMFWCILFLFVAAFPSSSDAWDQTDLELFDLVEEIQQNFYEVLEIDQSAGQADIRRAYRKLSLQLHPDKNKEEDAEEKFRQLVAVAEVLKDEEKRKKYDEILEHGLPDWRQPVFYYRRVRKMGLLELGLLLSAILSVGHYLVIWSMYFERKLEIEALIKPKREKKGKKASKQANNQPTTEEITQALLQDPNMIKKPSLADILPWKLVCLTLGIVQGLPGAYRSILEHWRARRKGEEKEEEDDGGGDESSRRKEQGPREKQRMDPAMYDYDRSASASVTMKTGEDAARANGLGPHGDGDSDKTKTSFEWSASEVSSLVKAMTKFPGGTTDRWTRIAEEIKKPVDVVTKKAKQLKSQKYATNIDAAAQGITGGIQHMVPSKRTGLGMTDDIMTHSTNQIDLDDESHEYSSEAGFKKNKAVKAVKTIDRTLMIASEAHSSDQRGNDTAVSNKVLQNREVDELVHSGVESCAWTQRQQKILEKAMQVYPRGLDDRWDKIADSVPGKSKEECIIRFKELVEVVKRRKQQTTPAQR